jgi:hypothetical protein
MSSEPRKIPSIALAKRSYGKAGSQSKKAIKAQGSTNPLKLEERRDKIASMVLTIQKELADVHIFKKTHDNLTPMEELSIKRTMTSMIWQEAMLEAMTLLIDCMSCREKVSGHTKDGTKINGIIRVSAASKIHDIECDTRMINERLEVIEGILLSEEEEEKEPQTKTEPVEEELELDEEEVQEVFTKKEDKKNDSNTSA